MRVQKFRAWDKENKEMLFVRQIDFMFEKVVLECYEQFFIDEVELMQSTGLKDINGEEVYEGDLLATPFEEDGLFEVCMDTTAGVYTKNLLTGNIQFIDNLESLEELEELKDELSQYIEIKGNIYENPELLGE